MNSNPPLYSKPREVGIEHSSNFQSAIASAVCIGTTLAVGPLVPQPGLAYVPAPRAAYAAPLVQPVAYAPPRIHYAAPLKVASALPAYAAVPARLPYPAPIAFPYGSALKIEATAPVAQSARPAVIPFSSVPAPLLKVAAAAPIARIAEPIYPPQPYSFGYEHTDEYGTKQSRQETSDANNAKTGSYGFTDARGVFRQVSYVADADGFRASVSTNEPGTAPSAPASVVYSARADNAVYTAPVAALARSATVLAPVAAPAILPAPIRLSH